jgi:hypothetical protein
MKNFPYLALACVVLLALIGAYYARQPKPTNVTVEYITVTGVQQGNGNSRFYVGETVYPAEGFSNNNSPKITSMANEGVVVVNLSDKLVRVKFVDGSEATYGLDWFISKEPTSPNWVVGNKFVVGQEVCAIPSSVREPFPNKGVVEKIDGDLVELKGYTGSIDFMHFQVCR